MRDRWKNTCNVLHGWVPFESYNKTLNAVKCGANCSSTLKYFGFSVILREEQIIWSTKCLNAVEQTLVKKKVQGKKEGRKRVATRFLPCNHPMQPYMEGMDKTQHDNYSTANVLVGLFFHWGQSQVVCGLHAEYILNPTPHLKQKCQDWDCDLEKQISTQPKAAAFIRQQLSLPSSLYHPYRISKGSAGSLL